MRLTHALLLFAAVSPSFAAGLSPSEALKRFRVPEGFEVRLVASEPMVRQPVSISFDDRGRLWVLQYLQYPNPAGLTPVAVDQFLRTKYDRIPEPPPKGPKGADRLTILFDPDESGRFRQAKDFVTGLNLASGFCVGHGGVYVMQPPYLLFYPDRNGDDVPDGEPKVVLTGFGTEDSHAYANSLQWGPDGWLYGAQGSTVTANVRGNEFQQGVWRYHPPSDRFELFAEGGGNIWGLDFDKSGQVIAGTNFGGFSCMHMVQGGYYVKNFGKHGALHNPHTYGYFDHIPCPNFKGGHVSCGGIVYRGGAFPKHFDDRYVACNLLSNAVYWYDVEPHGSTFMSRHAGELLTTDDRHFRPVDLTLGPDGAIYVADWYDERANHVDPVDNWDKSTGRIYRVAPKGTATVPTIDLRRMPTDDLLPLLRNRNGWYVREAQRLLNERRGEYAPTAFEAMCKKHDLSAFDSLVATFLHCGYETSSIQHSLQSDDAATRAWAVRLLGEGPPPRSDNGLLRLAARDVSPVVRAQVAATCRRVTATSAFEALRPLIDYGAEIHDPQLPLLIWWAVEDLITRDKSLGESLIRTGEFFESRLSQDELQRRAARRFVADRDWRNVADLMDMPPTRVHRLALIRDLEASLAGQRLERPPGPMADALTDLRRKLTERDILCFSVRLGEPGAFERLRSLAADSKTSDRVPLIELLGDMGRPDAVPVLVEIFRADTSETARSAALAALGAFRDDGATVVIAGLLPNLAPGLRGKAITHLAARPESALKLLAAVDAGALSPKDVPLDVLRRIATYKRDPLDAMIAKHWGRVAPESSGEILAHIRHLAARLREERGDSNRGAAVFTKHCATCHALNGVGKKVGPDLNTVDRRNRDWLLAQIVDPSAIVRPEFVSYDALTRDGRLLQGLIVEQSPQAVTLVDSKGDRTTLPRDKIESLEASRFSLMPEKLLDALSNEELRDLFAFLQSEHKP
ncbi:MAG: PVC-type heme-binding CxxCH protein [Gemmataceae bacterium]